MLDPDKFNAKMVSDHRGMNKPDRLQSKVDDALVQLNEDVQALENAVDNLQQGLHFVMNDYPRPSSDEEMKSPDSPDGDSSLLVRLHGLSDHLREQKNRINALMQRLDI